MREEGGKTSKDGDEAASDISKEAFALAVHVMTVPLRVSAVVRRSIMRRCPAHASESRSLHVVLELICIAERVLMERSMGSKPVLLFLIKHLASFRSHLFARLAAAWLSTSSESTEDILPMLATVTSQAEHLRKPAKEAGRLVFVMVRVRMRVRMWPTFSGRLERRQAHSHNRTRQSMVIIDGSLAVDCECYNLVDLVARRGDDKLKNRSEDGGSVSKLPALNLGNADPQADPANSQGFDGWNSLAFAEGGQTDGGRQRFRVELDLDASDAEGELIDELEHLVCADDRGIVVVWQGDGLERSVWSVRAKTRSEKLVAYLHFDARNSRRLMREYVERLIVYVELALLGIEVNAESDVSLVFEQQLGLLAGCRIAEQVVGPANSIARLVLHQHHAFAGIIAPCPRSPLNTDDELAVIELFAVFVD